jgi:fermentation-respiration switch protein FrsA (DUF1100 family)
MPRFLAFTAAVLAIFLVVIWVTQRRMIYLPFGDVIPPSRVGLDAVELVTFVTDDNLTLNGWLIPARAPATGDLVIVFNGNAGNRAYRADLARGLAELGIAVLLFDYRGYGENPGTPTEAGLQLDARAARRFVESRADVDRRRISYFGESLGAGIAVALALEHAPRALILRSPFTSLADAGSYHFPYLPVRWLLRDRFQSLERIARIECPLLVIAAARDSIVPTEQSRRLFEAAREPKRLVIIDGADHNDEALVAGPAVVGAVASYLRAIR